MARQGGRKRKGALPAAAPLLLIGPVVGWLMADYRLIATDLSHTKRFRKSPIRLNVPIQFS
jgi:hypothetical protein